MAPPDTTLRLVPLVSARLSAGFPSPAESYMEAPIDLQRYLIKNPTATFLMRVQGCSMEGAGIYDGDIAVIDRSRAWQIHSIVVARLGDEYTLKRIAKDGETYVLSPENAQYPAILLQEAMDIEIIGVLTFTIRQHGA